MDLTHPRRAILARAAVATLAVLAVPHGASAAITIAPPTAVALSGTAAPAGGNFSGFGTLLLNASGQVAFTSNLSGGSATAGIFAGAPNSLTTVALRGAPAPAGGNYSNLITDPLLNASGRVAALTGLTGGTSTQGVFAGAPGSLAAVALQGNATPAGGNFNGVNSSFVMNGSGQLAITANLTGGTSTSSIFVGVPGSLATVALEGNAAPAGGNYSFLGSPVLNASGQVAVNASFTGGTSGQGIILGAPGSLATVALEGNTSPAGGTYSTFGGRPALNDAGRVAFYASVSGGSSTAGIFYGTPGSVAAAALVGSAAPAGGNYSSFTTGTVLNGSGQLAFLANLTGGTSTSGIFVGAPGSITAAALQGAAAPGGGNYDGFGGGPPALNGAGQVAFTAGLTGTGVTTANDTALFASFAGVSAQVVREGDTIDVDPTAAVVNRTVAGIAFLAGSGGQDGMRSSFNDNGLLAYRLTFTDGSTGVFTS